MNPKHRLVKGAAAAGLAVALTTGIALASMVTGPASPLPLPSDAAVQAATLAYAPRSAQVTVLSAAAGVWYQVTYNGAENCMAAQPLEADAASALSEQEQTPEPQQAVVTDGPLNIRSGAGTDYDRVGALARGDVVTVTDQSVEGWYGVPCGDLSGYASAQYLSFDLDSVQPEPRQAVVTDGPLNVRSGAGTDYDRVGTLARGDVVSVTEERADGWFAITSSDLSGYVSAQYLSFDLDSVQPEPRQAVVTDGPLNVRSGAGSGYGRVGSLNRGTVVTVTDQSVEGWYGVTHGNLSGYASAQYLSFDLDSVATSTGSASSSTSSNSASSSAPVGSAGSSSVGESAAALAASLVGKPYVYGAAGPNGFDCSGLMYYIYRQLGYSIARGSSSQYNQSGYFVSTSEMQPGDLVYFFDPKFDSSGGTLPTTHVGIYVGNNQFIHASTTSYQVQYDALFGGYYGSYVVGVKRIA